MPGIGKSFPIAGDGSPLLSREALLVSMLVALGYPLVSREKQGRSNFQDVTREDGSRYFTFLFDGSVSQLYRGEPSLVRECADRIRDPESSDWRSAVYAAFDPGRAPAKALAALQAQVPRADVPAFEYLLPVYQTLLKEVAPMPKHLEIRRGGSVYYLRADEDIEVQIARLHA